MLMQSSLRWNTLRDRYEKVEESVDFGEALRSEIRGHRVPCEARCVCHNWFSSVQKPTVFFSLSESQASLASLESPHMRRSLSHPV